MGNLTKKDFIKIAKLIKNRYNLPIYSRDIRLFIPELCEYLKTTNGQFNEEAFKKACGVE
jgi:hypothetical protein